MRIVKLRVAESFIHASPMSLYLHRQAFGKSLLDDYSRAFSLGEIVEQSTAQKIFWTLSKTADLNLLEYEDWIYLLPDDNNWKLPVQKEINSRLYLPISDEDPSDEVSGDTNWEISILVNAKRMGLSFDELNLFTIQDFIDYQNMFLGQGNYVKEATQKDIDALLM